ncbi:class I SAM-dependent RNA methyltransferase [Tessaracoccus caeni]|uniref:class I SAM-dependent RNA methyltransferase n=1 Tax=Tessaracoccus caeni TaxID=3031239 RepID=UPI0023DA3E51|nr:TRAM domain-containing protein [Tessaracoccus caeni]MDF1488515.1 TRAM domain-containing protein [Tessaracoccus caeni]
MTEVRELSLERVAHQGVVVGRHEGKVMFVTGGLPGERVRVEVTERGASFDRGHVVEVLTASLGRMTPACPVADRCGGCDWQHATTETERELKTAVVAEQLSRLAGLDWDGEVQDVLPATGWRTRMRYAVDDGHIGLRARRSHEVVELPDQGCLIAAPGPSVDELRALARQAEEQIEVIVADDRTAVLVDGKRGNERVSQQVGGRTYTLAASGFWQVHPRAASLLTERVLAGLEPRPGKKALDLYCGAGLFAGALAERGCDVFGIELSAPAIDAARRNVPEARFLAAPLERALNRFPRRAGVVVLDPPRKGAGRAVVRAVAAVQPRAIAYVACDPAALGRDLAHFAAAGYRPTSVEAFNLFPRTHHVECVAILHRGA